MTNIRFNRSSTPPGNHNNWSTAPADNANYQPASFPQITDGFTPLPAFPGLFLASATVTGASASIDLPFALLNSLENIQVNYDKAATIRVANFADVDIATNLTQKEGDSSVDVINAQRGSINTGKGNDTISVLVVDSNSGEDNSHQFDIRTGKGNDTVSFSNTTGSFATQTADIFLTLGEGNNTVITTEVLPVTNIFPGNFHITADSGNDNIQTGTGSDTIASGAGADTVNSGGSADIIFAGKGHDLVNGDETVRYYSPSNDTLIGGAGHDTINGGGGRNVIFGDNAIAYDKIDASFLANLSTEQRSEIQAQATLRHAFDASTIALTGDKFNYGDTDIFKDEQGNDVITSSGRYTGSGIIFGGGGNDTVTGGPEDDIIHGDGSKNSSGNDYIDGISGHDTIWGGDGADTIYGGLGLSINGVAGNDMLSGGADNARIAANGFTYTGNGDFLSGGSGTDVFVINKQSNVDVIADFSAEEHDILRVAYYKAADVTGLGTSILRFDGHGHEDVLIVAQNSHIWTLADIVFV
jgi:Ca2+-binding RTX toxin-like protein